MRKWPVIEWDQNNYPRIFDIVTEEYAKEFKIGQEVVVVCWDKVEGILDWGSAFIGTCSEIKQLNNYAWRISVEKEWIGYSLMKSS